MSISWNNRQDIGSHKYRCKYCGESISSEKGYIGDTQDRLGAGRRDYICICHSCNKPTYIDHTGNQYPGVPFGDTVEGIDAIEVASLYEEARNCASVNAYTASAMACRKILMNVAVTKGAKEGLKFVQYVQHLADNGFVPPDGKDWVEHIKDKGNDANHKIEITPKGDAEELLYFTEMLLTFIYAVPARFKKHKKIETQTQ